MAQKSKVENSLYNCDKPEWAWNDEKVSSNARRSGKRRSSKRHQSAKDWNKNLKSLLLEEGAKARSEVERGSAVWGRGVETRQEAEDNVTRFLVHRTRETYRSEK